MATVIGWFLRGFVIGIANIIPGVSGGTMALVLGIYERLIGAIHSITPQTFLIALKALTFKKEAIDAGFTELKRIDGYFVGTLGIGAVAAIGVFAKVIELLLKHYHDPTYAFFCGLILLSIITPLKMLKRFSWQEAVTMVIAIVLTVMLANQMIGPKAVAKAERKHALKTAIAEQRAANKAAEAGAPAAETAPAVADPVATSETPAGLEVRTSNPAASSPTVTATAVVPAATAAPGNVPAAEIPDADHSPGTLLWFFFCGALAISAMILPGISGSFLMLLLGVYFDIIAAIGSRDVITLGAFAVGCGLGILAFSRLLNWLFEHYRDPTIASLIGLMLGSMYGLWPFRSFTFVPAIGGDRVDTALILPAANGNLALSILAFLAGCAIILVFLKYESASADAKAKAAATPAHAA